MRVAVTGSCGRVGSLLVPRLREEKELELVLIDRVAPSEERPAHLQVDICDLDSMTRVLRGCQGVVHLAGNPAVSASWEELEAPNVAGLVRSLQAAASAGVSKFVFASTNHVTGMYDREERWPGSLEVPVRPDSLYGATKAFGEAVGRYFSDTCAMSVICLRIGWVLERPHNEHARQMWLSPGDLGRLVSGALRSEVRFGIYYGLSANRQARWPIDNARLELGYEPQDDSERYFDAGAAQVT